MSLSRASAWIGTIGWCCWGGMAAVALFTLLANTQGDNQIYGKATREIAPKAK